MSKTLPATVVRLLACADPRGLHHAWAEFVAEYSRLILHVPHSHGGAHDDVMDRYTYVLEQLQCDDLRRLRGDCILLVRVGILGRVGTGFAGLRTPALLPLTIRQLNVCARSGGRSREVSRTRLRDGVRNGVAADGL